MSLKQNSNDLDHRYEKLYATEKKYNRHSFSSKITREHKQTNTNVGLMCIFHTGL